MSATQTAAAKSSAPPAPVPPEAPLAAAAAPPSPPRPVRPLSPTQIQLAEFATRHHVLTLAIGQEFDDLFRVDFWAGIAQRLRVCDTVSVFSARNDLFAELLVRQVSIPDGVRGSKGGATVYVLRHHELEPLDRRPRPVEHVVEFRGPANLWCVVRISDGAVVAHHLDTREAAEQHLARMATAQA
jgi:hypothetical protein